MTWRDAEWDAFCGLVEEAWHGEFDDHTRSSWRVLLDPLQPAAAVEGLRRLLLEGYDHRPSASRFLAAARHDASLPTFDEAFQLIFGTRGVLCAPPPRNTVYDTDADRQAAIDEAMLERAKGMHPMVAAFVHRTGIRRLRRLPINDPQWGEKHRADLKRAWGEHVEAFDGREVAALASGRGKGELARLDPLAALGVTPAPQLEAGDR